MGHDPVDSQVRLRRPQLPQHQCNRCRLEPHVLQVARQLRASQAEVVRDR